MIVAHAMYVTTKPKRAEVAFAVDDSYHGLGLGTLMLAQLADAAVDADGLPLAGHLHGGQVAIPFVRRPAIPSRYGERYARGHIVEDGRHLYVSSGLGTSGLPLRFLAPLVNGLRDVTRPSHVCCTPRLAGNP